MKIIFLKNKYFKTKKNGGFALLFTVVIVSAIAVITAGLTNTIYKQMILSSLVKDSNSAFYEADTAADCALYADLIAVSMVDSTFLKDHKDTANHFWSCGGMSLKVTGWNHTDPYGDYNLLPDVDSDFSGPCFNIEVKRVINFDEIKDKNVTTTSIKAKGYNICDQNSSRAVEREIDIDYKG